MTINELEQKILAIKALVEVFKVERYACMCVMLLCIIILLAVGILALQQNKIETSYFVGLMART
jgi:hypothetical protein